MLARLITGLTLAAGILALVSWGPPWGIWLLIQVAALIAIVEWYRFRATAQGWAEVFMAMLVSASLPAVAFLEPGLLSEAVAMGCVVVLVGFVLRPGSIPDAWQRMTFALTGVLYPGMLLAMVVLVATHDPVHGRWYVLILFAAVWFGDTGAYFAGRFLGRHKLHPTVSPKKTWEGALGGVAGSVGGVFFVKALFVPGLSVVDAVVVAVGCSVLEQVGDLAESLFKRSFDVKDSGSILPGHGGMLDRIDGLLFAAPFMWLYVEWFRPQMLS